LLQHSDNYYKMKTVNSFVPFNFETVFYVMSADYNIYMDIQQAIYFDIHEHFEQEDIEFAYPTQTLFVAKTGD